MFRIIFEMSRLNPEQFSIMALAQIIAEEVGYNGGGNFDMSKPDGQYSKPSSKYGLYIKNFLTILNILSIKQVQEFYL